MNKHSPAVNDCTDQHISRTKEGNRARLINGGQIKGRGEPG